MTPEESIALLTTFTGIATFNISGTTLHSIFQYHTHNYTLDDEKKTILYNKLHQLQHFVNEECSMVSSQILALINDNCSLVKYTDATDQNFGNASVHGVRDLYQLPPVKGSLTDIAPLIWETFKFH